ncbi:PF07588 family protein [Leptospira santarosai]|uniref:PF07588 family protein n=1 Tax=Leptospira santarosai TaxID=28183 RepID=A0A2P1QUT8_9LEPT|nr:PF07588 family protein [Leptospira santarosai]
MTVFFGGYGGGEHSDSFGTSSLKNSLLNLVDSHSNNSTSIPSGGFYVFVTSYTNSFSVSPLTHNGNFADISGADAYCNSHIPSGLPGTGSYKAMLVDGINRVATTVGANSSSGQKDWVFEKTLRITDRMKEWYTLQMTLGFLIFLWEVLSKAFSDSFYLWNLDRTSIQLENRSIYTTLFFLGLCRIVNEIGSFLKETKRSRGITTILAIVICCRRFQTTTFCFYGILSLSIQRTVLFVIFRAKKTIYEVRVKNIRW